MKTADSNLLRAWIDHRDAEAFAEIVRRYAGLVYGSAIRILANSPDAEDVSQECFLALAGTDGPAPRSLPAWLHAVATRQALKRIRSDRTRERRERAQAERTPEGVDPAWEDIKSYVDEAIEDLPEDLRYAVTAHFLLQRTHRMIARELGVTRQAVSYRIGRGVEQIRRGLKRRGISAPVALLGTLLGAHAHAAVPSELSASLGKLAIAGTPGRGVAAAHVSSALRIPVLTWSALALVTISLVGAGIMMLRREEAPAIASPVSPTVSPLSPVEVPAQLPTPAQTEPSAREPDPRPALIATPATQEEPSEKPEFDRLVSGRVYDLDTGLPVADATVVAEYKATRRLPSGLSQTSVHVQQGLTDSMGVFHIASLRPKRYTLWVSTELQDLVDQGTEADLRFRDELRGVDIGVSLKDPNRAKIEGFVTNGVDSIEGQVIQVQYDPILRIGTEDAEPRNPGSALSGRNGEYVLKEMRPGTAVLTLHSTLANGRLTQFIEIQPGETYIVDFDILVGADGGIEGWIVPPPGGEGTLVRAYTDNRDGVSVQWTSRSTPEGHYRFFGLPEGLFEVAVEPDGDQGRITLPSGAQSAIVGLTGGDEVIRVTTGLWTRLYTGLSFGRDVRSDGWTYPPRQYFATFEDAVAQSTADFVLYGNYGSKFVTVEPGTIARLDFDFTTADNP